MPRRAALLSLPALSLSALGLLACGAPPPAHGGLSSPSAPSGAAGAQATPPGPPIGSPPRPAQGRAVKVRVDQGHACATLASGEVACWGENQVGELGLAERTESSVPLLIPGVSGATLAIPLGGISGAGAGAAAPLGSAGPGGGARAVAGQRSSASTGTSFPSAPRT